MASLRLPRLCCPTRDDGTNLVLGSTIYHTICGCSALLGLLSLALCYRPTKVQNQRMGGRLLLAGSMVTAGLLVNSILWLSLPDFLSNQSSWPPRVLCIVISTWIHYFSCALFWAFFCYSLEIAQLLSANPSERYGMLFTFLCWGFSSLLVLSGLLMMIPSEESAHIEGSLAQTGKAVQCDSRQGLVLFHDVILYIPLLFALFGSPILLRRAIVRAASILKMRCGVYTSTERSRKRSLCRRLLGINGVFIACWLGNVLCDFTLLLVEILGTPQAPRQIKGAALTLFIITGILNPVFCGMHSLAFYGWRSSSAPSVNQSGGAAAETQPVSSEEEERAENEHLLLCSQSEQSSRELSVPILLQMMDSYPSMELRCSALEINAVRLLGTSDSMTASLTGSEPKSQHSSV